ncbi:uncharacterized protein DUF2219 [Flavobacteriaceae bacterium MAR_2010_72]|nr:uncharacterized protein DUF2219 [Flavobacteriaceae bacterium MAR_2010_72]
MKLFPLGHFQETLKINNLNTTFWFWFLTFCIIYPLNAQDHNLFSTNKDEIRHQISFRHDNDFLTFTDYYYSSGLFLSYDKVLSNGLFNSGHEQLGFALTQEIYTPSRLTTTNLVEMDRPYAGFMALSLGWSLATNTHFFEAQLSLGLAGKASGAGAFHRWYHNALDVPGLPTWAHELENKVHSNLYFKYAYELQLAPNNFSVHLALNPEVAVGTKSIYAQPELLMHFGKRNAMNYSMAYNRIKSIEDELFFTLRAGYRFVNHNAMLEGHLLGDSSVFLVEPDNGYLFGGFDLKHRSRQNAYWFGLYFNQAETKDTKGHSYIMLSYARRF